MSKILVVYASDPPFPATVQHPEAVRYQVDRYILDALEGEPTLQEIDAFFNPPEKKRVEAFEADAEQVDLRDRLRTATPAQIDDWFNANVTTLAQARSVLKAIVKYLVARRMF